MTHAAQAPDYVTCPTCRGAGRIATLVQWDQRTYRLTPLAPEGAFICPTCAGSKEILAPVCTECGHVPTACSCRAFCACGQPAIAWYPHENTATATCAAHALGHPTEALVPPTRGKLLLSCFLRREGERLRTIRKHPRRPVPPRILKL